jgi:hypothetical protein
MRNAMTGLARPIAALLLAVVLLAAPLSAQRQPRAEDRQPPAADAVPTLVVLIAVDQLRGDYFDRFRGLSGGLARLSQGGAWFSNAHHDHATTETAPGHSVLLAGRHPRSTGIVRNNAGIQDPLYPLIGAQGQPASPFRFRGGTLVDWLRVKHPQSRTLSVSRKDRGAILMVGRAPQHVYWYADAEGGFTTSTYYRDTLPTWVSRFNRERSGRRFAGQQWTLLRPASEYPAPDLVQAGDDRGTGMPRTLPPDSALAARVIPQTPFMDEMTLEFALTGLREMELGSGPHTDVLAISLSAMDHIGHRWGPDSREIHDQMLQLDRMLGAFFDTLFTVRDSTRIAVVLTGDHGVAPYPEEHFGWAGQESGPGRVETRDILQRFQGELVRRGVDSTALSFDGGMILADTQAFQRARVNADSAVRALGAELSRRRGVQRVDLVRDLARADPQRDPIARRWLHSIPEDLPVIAVVTLEPYWYPASITYATHGTPHDYDSHVPIIFYGAQFRAGRHEMFVRTVDIAPTLAWITNTTPLDRLDGQVLWQALR